VVIRHDSMYVRHITLGEHRAHKNVALAAMLRQLYAACKKQRNGAVRPRQSGTCHRSPKYLPFLVN
jgi:hypothetical protein